MELIYVDSCLGCGCAVLHGSPDAPYPWAQPPCERPGCTCHRVGVLTPTLAAPDTPDRSNWL